MGAIFEFTSMTYQMALIPIIFYSIFLYSTALMNIFGTFRNRKHDKQKSSLPFVTIQIPVFNDPVAVRCIKKCLQFDYPKNKYEIIVADDSTDEFTIRLLNKFKNRVKILHRNNRKGFKAGALNYALKHSRGDIIVIFDSDFVPGRLFLKKIIKPFEDKKVAIVQSKMGYINPNTNWITKFASTLLMIFHNIWMPVFSYTKTNLFCGSGGAIRKDVLLKCGGWNEKSLTEDADLSIKVLDKGYKIVYLPNLISKGEVPFTFFGFIRQQMRWSYGLTRVFIDNIHTILFGKFSFIQKFFLLFQTLSVSIAPIVIIMALAGQLLWITRDPKPITLRDLVNLISILIATGGVVFCGGVALYQERHFKNFLTYVFSTYTIGLALSFYNSIAFIRAVLNQKMIWVRTPKWGSLHILQFIKRLFIK
ncbi:MAG: glycosyltransferase family 2 protein [Candidatus Aenigmatarchaeota archaeon]